MMLLMDNHQETELTKVSLKYAQASAHMLSLTLQERCGRFRKWLQDQPQKVIVVVGHSTFFKVFTSSPHRLKNCEIQTILI